ncbi:peptide chain release factor N(5)-glutamine methyltransferase [Micrococcoides hystricis]|uniref:Release factor glutamine methyltransferase n=1 Tax=Micrococcoides hystricis TaxID=1572761 RepID=A0ABV6PBU0_9MICC
MVSSFPLLADALKAATAELAAAGVPSPRVDAELLAAHLLGVSRGRVGALALLDTPTPEGLAELVAQRAQRIPLQHLTGSAPFRGLELAVGPGVFTPRFETEILVEHALVEVQRVLSEQGSCQVIDLATGSGAIALAIKTEAPGAHVAAVELSELALAWAQKNLAGSGVELIHGDLRTAATELNGRCDVVVSNPPYIPADQVPIDQEVHEHDPHMALYGGGEDGLQLPLAVAARGVELLVPGGLLLMEHAETQGSALRNAFARRPDLAGHYEPAHTYPDLAGKDRITVARKVTQ